MLPRATVLIGLASVVAVLMAFNIYSTFSISTAPRALPVAINSTSSPQRTSSVTHKLNTSLHKPNTSLHDAEFERIERRYNLTNARKGKDAVKDAVSFLLKQQSKIFEHDPPVQRSFTVVNSSTSEQPYNRSGWYYERKCVAGGDCPVCNVTMQALLQDGELRYLGDDALPTYNHTCWAARVRYHTSPVCERHEASRGVKPISRFAWGLGAAHAGYCRLPSTIPQHVAREYLARNAASPSSFSGTTGPTKSPTPLGAEKRRLTVLMLGLSFMGQPFQALNCLYSQSLTDGRAFHIFWQKGDFNTTIPLEGIRANGGQCTGYKHAEIAKYFPRPLHPGAEWDILPKQNYELCHMDSFLSIFGARNETAEVEMVVCYQYTFGVERTVPVGSSLPCRLNWPDIDVIISISSPEEIFRHYIERTGGKGRFKQNLRIVFVDNIYQGLLHNQLSAAVRDNGFGYKVDPDDYGAKFANCSAGSSDIHYRLPGLPDMAINMWLSLLSSGLIDSSYQTDSGTGIRYWI